VTGAPLEHIPFRDVVYWSELVQICDWAAAHVGSTIYVCWAAFAALHSFHGVPMRILPRKLSGIFKQQVMDAQEPLTARLGATFTCPVSRHAEVTVHDVPWRRGLVCLAQSPRSGLCLIADERRSALYMFNHLEYDVDTLKLEYLRDRSRRACRRCGWRASHRGDVLLRAMGSDYCRRSRGGRPCIRAAQLCHRDRSRRELDGSDLARRFVRPGGAFRALPGARGPHILWGRRLRRRTHARSPQRSNA
jgi:hypothetical protein